MMQALGKFFVFSRWRYLIYLAFFGLWIALQWGLYFQSSKYESLAIRLQNTIQKAIFTQPKRKQLQDHLVKLSFSDPYFLKTRLEKFSFLGENRLIWEELSSHPLFQKTKNQKLLFSKPNHLEFQVISQQKNPLFYEVLYAQNQEIELNKKELESLLSLLEAVFMGSNEPDPKVPDYTITQFHLKSHSPNFLLNVELLERKKFHE